MQLRARVNVMTAAVLAFAVVACPGADEHDDGHGDHDTDAGHTTDAGDATDSGTNVCDAADCGPNGHCVVVDGLPECECDEGWVEQGLSCVRADTTDPQPPAGFTCPAPGAATEAEFTAFAGKRWYYVSNDRACTKSGYNLFEFRANGVFTRRFQFSPQIPGAESGQFVYGCWTYTRPAENKLALSWTHANDTSLNCSQLGRLRDPPCTDTIESVGDGTWKLAPSFAFDQELHVVREVGGGAECKWCSTSAECCPKGGWVKDGDTVICR